MSAQLETEVANLTASVNELLDAVNIKKTQLDAAVESARINANVYLTTSAGLAATLSGEYFSVISAVSTQYLLLYRNDAGVATYIKSMPSEESVTAVTDTTNTHIANVVNPHSVTKAQVELGNVTNTSDANKPVSTAQQTAFDLKLNGVVDNYTADYPTIRPTLNLDFANSKQVDPRITFTRASTATYTDEQGLLRTAAAGSPRIDHDPITGECKGLLIEEQRTNLLTYSEQFDNAAWTKSNATITANNATAPDGTMTTDKIVEATTNTNHGIQVIRWSGSAGNHTNTFFVKKLERTFAYIETFTSTLVRRTVFDLVSGEITDQASEHISASIVPLGSDWFRISVTINLIETARWRCGPSSGSTNASTAYTGDGTSGIYIWGAQLEAGAFPTSYIPSTETFTSRASTATYIGSDGLIQSAAIDEARYQYNPNNLTVDPFLLLEPQRTNLLTYSEQFDTAAWTQSNLATVSPNIITAPDGTMTADKIIENTGTSSHGIRHMYAFAASTTYTASWFIKAGERTSGTFLVLENGTSIGAFHINLVTGEIAAGSTALKVIPHVLKLPNGWWFFSLTFTTGADPLGSYFDFRMSNVWPVVGGTGTGYTGDGTSGMYFWGAQLEEASYPTSYIPTVESQVTRSADLSTSSQTTRVADNASMTGENFSDWYRQDEGVFLGKFSAQNPGGAINSRLFQVDNGSDLNRMAIARNGSGRGSVLVSTPGFSSWAATTDMIWPDDGWADVALAYKNQDMVVGWEENVATTNSVISVPFVHRLTIGNRANIVEYLNGHIKRLTYFPKRLTNTQLQTLTRP